MDCSKLEKNIIDTIEEQQLKLGYLKETVRLYYPLSSLNRFLDTEDDIEMMKERLQKFSEATKEKLGGITVTNEADRFCIMIPPSGTEYIHMHMAANGFLADLIKVVGRHECTLKEVMQQFYKYSENVHIEEIKNGEFDYLIYFENGIPDGYRYCVTEEAGHIIYHRYTAEDYKDFKF